LLLQRRGGRKRIVVPDGLLDAPARSLSAHQTGERDASVMLD
jgi:hypothetical protein